MLYIQKRLHVGFALSLLSDEASSVGCWHLAPLLCPWQGLQPKDIKMQHTDQIRREGEKARGFLPQPGSCRGIIAEVSRIDSSAVRE